MCMLCMSIGVCSIGVKFQVHAFRVEKVQKQDVT